VRRSRGVAGAVALALAKHAVKVALNEAGRRGLQVDLTLGAQPWAKPTTCRPCRRI
jgi:hypothetical protein